MARNSMRIGFALPNFAAMTKTIQALPAAMQARVMKGALARAARPIVQAAKQRAPKRTGALRRSITAIVREYPRAGKVIAIIGPDHGTYAKGARLKAGVRNGKVDRPAKYAHLVEFGHYTGTRSGKFGGFAKGFKRSKAVTAGLGSQSATAYVLAQPFLRPAVMGATNQSADELARAVEAGMAREVERLRVRLRSNRLQLAT